ncbi:MAG: ribonuclease III [Phycisphaerae bacterium]|nr:ribonuclease III [Phycisphaerae bacterium]
MDAVETEQIEAILDYQFKDHDLLELALRHASWTDSRLQSNERLEFLGDAILGMVVCTTLFENFPDSLEGDLTKIKSNVVSRRACADVANELELQRFLKIGKGMGSRSNLPQSLAAAVYESVIGAIYLDGGLEPARDFILAHMEPLIQQASELGHQHNFKSVLQQYLQSQEKPGPVYVILDEQGPDHAKCFEVCVEMGHHRFPGCWGPSKKQAEQQAALEALLELKAAVKTEDGHIRIDKYD